MQKPGKAQPGQKVGNTIVSHPWIIPKIQRSQLKGWNTEYLKAQAKHYRAPTWAKEDTQEDGDQNTALPSTNLEKDGVYLVRCLNIGILEALELYNDDEKGFDIHCTETMESFTANTLAPRKKPTKAAMGKQTKHTNSQRLVEEASKGKPKLPFEEIVLKEY